MHGKINLLDDDLAQPLFDDLVMAKTAKNARCLTLGLRLHDQHRPLHPQSIAHVSQDLHRVYPFGCMGLMT